MNVSFKGKTYPGRVLRQTDDFVWVQSGKNWSQVINGYQPITGIPAEAMAKESVDSVESSTEPLPSTEDSDGK